MVKVRRIGRIAGDRARRASRRRRHGVHGPRSKGAGAAVSPDARLRPHAVGHGACVRGALDRRRARRRRRQRARARVVAAVGQGRARRRSSICTASAGASATTCSESHAGASSVSTCWRSTTAASDAATATCRPRRKSTRTRARRGSELARREPRRELRFIYGHSLGAAVALELGATVDDAAGVIAEAGFTSIADLVAESYAPLNLLVSQSFDALARAKAAEGAGAVHPRHRRPLRAAGDEREAVRGRAAAEAAAHDRRRATTATGTARDSTTTGA